MHRTLRTGTCLIAALLSACGGGDELSPGATTTVRVHYPAVGPLITLRGSSLPLSWDTGTALTFSDDTWTFSTTALSKPAEVKPLLDDSIWSRGPNYHVAPGQSVDLYPRFTSTAGQVVTLLPTFHSTALNNDRAIHAYLPASYDENPLARYPVIYMHDGQNIFDAATAFGGVEWRVDESLDAAAESGRCVDGAACQSDADCATSSVGCLATRETIVIGIDNTPQRTYELTPTLDTSVGDGGGADMYLTMVVDELKPLVDSRLRTAPGPGDTAIMGSSLGGLLSAYAGVSRPDVFGSIGAMSPSTWWDNLVIVSDVSGSAGAVSRPARVYVDSGDSGSSNDSVTDTNTLAQTYLDIGYREGTDFHHLVQPGATHTELYWAQRFPGAAFFVMGPRLP